MSKQLFSIAGVDSLGKHTFIKRNWDNTLTTTYDPTDAVYIGSNVDIDKFIEECHQTFDVNQTINYIPYTVKSNITELQFYSNDLLKGTYTIH